MTREEFLALLPELVDNYRPSSEVVRKINGICLLMIIGPSGAGKTTLMKSLPMPYVPSDTTRPVRPEEVEGIDYVFRTDYKALMAEIKAGGFVQVAIGSGGDFYGTKASSYPNSGWATMAVVADVIPIFRTLGFAETLSAFIVPPSFEEWQQRMSSHNLSGQQRRKRLEEAVRTFNFAATDSHTHPILNDKLEYAADQLKALVAGNVDEPREKKAKECIKKLLTELELVNP